VHPFVKLAYLALSSAYTASHKFAFCEPWTDIFAAQVLRNQTQLDTSMKDLAQAMANLFFMGERDRGVGP